MAIRAISWRRRGGVGRALRIGWRAAFAASPTAHGDESAGATADATADASADASADALRASPAPGAAPVEFEAFFHAHERAVYACLWRLTGDTQTARDLTQETFLRAWRHYERVSAYEQPRAWLLRVATNLALTARRRSHSHTLSTAALADADQPAQSDATRTLAERDAVEQALLALPPRQRAALTLREVYGLSCAEIGAMLGLSRDAVKMALYRGRESFRRHYLGQEARDER